MKGPVSEKQLEANRLNAQKSTGPRTAEGKARSAQNAIKHGFAASSLTVVYLEEADELSNLKADAVAFYRPQNSQEMFAVEAIALAQWKMLRWNRLETGLLTEALDRTTYSRCGLDTIEGQPITPIQKCNFDLADGFLRQVEQNNVWPLLLRYQAQAERLYRRAIEDFNRLKKLRGELSPNEPIEVTQPPENTELATPEALHFPFALNPEAPPQPPEPTKIPTLLAPSRAQHGDAPDSCLLTPVS